MEFSRVTEVDCRQSLRNSHRYCERPASSLGNMSQIVTPSKNAGAWLAATTKRDKAYESSVSSASLGTAEAPFTDGVLDVGDGADEFVEDLFALEGPVCIRKGTLYG